MNTALSVFLPPNHIFLLKSDEEMIPQASTRKKKEEKAKARERMIKSGGTKEAQTEADSLKCQ